MKTINVLLAAFLIMMTALQVSSQTKLSIGIHAGLNFAGASITPSQTTGTRTGIIIGGMVDIGISKEFSVAPGLQYISKGASTNEGGFTSSTSLNYLEIPVVVMYKFEANEFMPHVFAGPCFAFNLSANSETSGGGGSSSSDVSSSLGAFDMGLLFGTGTEYKLKTGMGLYLDIGYAFGLSNVSKESSVSVKNNGLRLTAGVKFSL
jgi:hypothetical protein